MAQDPGAWEKDGGDNEQRSNYYVVDFDGQFEVRTEEELKSDLEDDLSLRQRIDDGDVLIIKGTRVYPEVNIEVLLHEDGYEEDE